MVNFLCFQLCEGDLVWIISPGCSLRGPPASENHLGGLLRIPDILNHHLWRGWVVGLWSLHFYQLLQWVLPRLQSSPLGLVKGGKEWHDITTSHHFVCFWFSFLIIFLCFCSLFDIFMTFFISECLYILVILETRSARSRCQQCSFSEAFLLSLEMAVFFWWLTWSSFYKSVS